MFSFNPGRFRPPSLGVSTLLVLVVIAAIAFDTAHYLRLKSVAQRYSSSPECSAGNVKIDPSLPPCTVKAYTVLQAYQSVTVSSSGRHTHYHTHTLLSIRAADGDQRTIEFPNTSLWASLHQGDPIKVQLWQGKSQLVYAQGQTGPTINNPDYQAQEAGWVDVILVALGLGIVVFLVYGIIRTARAGLAPGPYTAGFNPSEPTMAPIGYPMPAMGFPSGAPVANAVQGAATVSGAWRGSWGASGAQAHVFDAFLEVNNSGVIKGRFVEPGRVSEASVAGEQEGNDFRFLKRGLRQGAAEGVEFRGQIGPDGRSIYGVWSRRGRVLGIPFKTAGNWSATRLADPSVASPVCPNPAEQ